MTAAGIDMGTQSVKVVLYDSVQKKVIAQAQSPFEVIAESNGAREQKAAWYAEGLDACFSAFDPALKKTVEAVGVSAHQHGFVPLDASGAALYNVKLWNDTSTAEECGIITEKAGGAEAVIGEINNLMLPGFTAPKILWLKRHKPDAFSRLRYIMLPHDYLNYLLTGEYKAEEGDASGTALYNGARRKWSKKICDIIDEKLYGLLPPVISADEKNGVVSEAAAARWGLRAGTPVSSGGGDNMMAAIGTGTVEDGFLTMSLGTSGTLFGYSDKPFSAPRDGISGFNSSTGGYLPLLCTMNCTVASEETRSLFGLGVKEFDAEAEKAPIGCGGVVFLPFFNGERTPNLPNGRAGINGISAANCARSNIARAALESAVFGMRCGIDAFRALGFAPREIRITGGGGKSPIWRQMAADVMNLPVKRPENDESGALGAAIQALWCLLKIKGEPVSIAKLCSEHVSIRTDECALPNTASVKAYEKAYGEYKKYLEALSPLFK
ncbi:MAG: xylulokinase [Spirochaetaceae bacterium]|jgi:xylulokinase|nr:xylulokinase [Spirochaetaceae bacterium]